MSQIEWAMWANEQAVASSSVLLVGSIVGITGMFHNWPFGVYGLIASLLVLVLEWPRSKRKKGTTMERHFQKAFTVIVDKLGVFGRNYFVRFVLYLILCVPCYFILATIMGGLCLFVTSIIYFIAALKGEEWKPTGLEGGDGINKKRLQSLHPPNKPPPRAITTTNTAAGSNNDTTETTCSAVDVGAIAVSIETKNEVKFSKKSKKETKSEEEKAAPKRPPTRVPPRPKAAARQGIQDRK